MNKIRAVAIIITSLLLLPAGSSIAQIKRYVKPTASGSGDGSSWSNASASLQTVINASATGDSIFVARGKYKPAASINMKEGVKIYGSFAGTEVNLAERTLDITNTDVSIIDGSSNGSLCAISNSYLTAAALLDGFTITGAYNYTTSNGGGLYNYYASPTISNCSFNHNLANYSGGGIYNAFSSPRISNCIFSNNRASNYSGGGIYNSSSSPIIRNCTFNENGTSINGGGGGIFNTSSSPIISNCTFTGNFTAYGGGIYNASSSPKISNCTFYRNKGSLHGGGMYNTYSSPIISNCSFSGNAGIYGGAMFNAISSLFPTITNCIAYGNSSGIIEENPGATTKISYSLIQDFNNTNNGNIDGGTDPLFVNATNGNLQMQSGSPCINSGDSTGVSQYLGYTDVAGRSRYSGTIDMGSYEWQPPTKWYVKPAAAGGDDHLDGKTWATAFATIQRGIDTANANDSVFVKKGIYHSEFSINMKDGIKIYGSFTGTEDNIAQRIIGTASSADTSIIDGSNNIYGSAVISNNLIAAAVIDGFKITGGKSGGMLNDSSRLTITNCTFNGNGQSGGIYNNFSPLIISNCIFSRNKTLYSGGGIYNFSGSNAVVNHCIFSGNRASDYGGGIANSGSSPIISNCIFSGNSSGNKGGGIYNTYASYPTINNCTFSGNDAYFGGGGMFNYYSTGKLKNCIVYGNRSGILNEGGGNTISYSLVQGMAVDIANHNLDGNTDPLFVNAPAYFNAPFTDGNYHLLPGSPALNAGDSASISQYTGGTDVVGMPRYQCIIDIGAYEEVVSSYTFTGNGAWSNPANWQNGIIPPATLTGSDCILIKGNVTLDTPQTISKPAALLIQSGASLLLPYNLIFK